MVYLFSSSLLPHPPPLSLSGVSTNPERSHLHCADSQHACCAVFAFETHPGAVRSAWRWPLRQCALCSVIQCSVLFCACLLSLQIRPIRRAAPTIGSRGIRSQGAARKTASRQCFELRKFFTARQDQYRCGRICNGHAWVAICLPVWVACLPAQLSIAAASEHPEMQRDHVWQAFSGPITAGPMQPPHSVAQCSGRLVHVNMHER